jgi:hypothetical protein
MPEIRIASYKRVNHNFVEQYSITKILVSTSFLGGKRSRGESSLEILVFFSLTSKFNEASNPLGG